MGIFEQKISEERRLNSEQVRNLLYEFLVHGYLVACSILELLHSVEIID